MSERRPADGIIVRTDVMPAQVAECRTAGRDELNLRAICVFAATGFFLGADHYWSNRHVLQPATEYELTGDGVLVRAKRYWSWHHSPRDISFDQAVDEFTHVFERIARKQVAGKKVILPLSGGLDSRTQAAALAGTTELNAYSYRLEGGHDEVQYGRAIARAIRVPFTELVIRRGYLWAVIDELARINGCMSDFTHPRQMAVIDEVAALGEVFSLGHWGDVLFDDMGIDGAAPLHAQVEAVLAKIVKKGGNELASALWDAWGLEGTFGEYLRERVATLLAEIPIDDANSRLRAFKSLYWAPRWTTVNLSVFASRRPIVLPYYERDMCEFVCTLPERYLARRRIQIEYLKRRAPALARIPWQSVHPFNLYTHEWFRSLWMLPYRAARRVVREARTRATGQAQVIRNWELQLLGLRNDVELAAHLFSGKSLAKFIPMSITSFFYEKFKTLDQVKYAHPISMLLTLAMFAQLNLDKKEQW